MRRDPTEAEALLWERLRGRKIAGAKFRRQHPLGRYIADFCCIERKLVVELDGRIHSAAERAQHDQVRDQELDARGYSVLRISADDVANRMEPTLARIEQAITGSYPAPHRAKQQVRCRFLRSFRRAVLLNRVRVE